MKRETLILEDGSEFNGFVFEASTNISGEVGVPDEKIIDDFGLLRWVESDKIYASGLIVSAYTEHLGIDTRILTKELREHGTMLGKKPHVFNSTGKISMVCVDCGLKNNQLRILCQLDAKLMALAAGMKITKLKYGNRGYNQPCLLEETQHCFITSQNHSLY
ncbi:unnamed protein product [Rotaria sp. Silwood1]|nr:unnamed protein product [Rotaria sp. Silwood1]